MLVRSSLPVVLLCGALWIAAPAGAEDPRIARPAPSADQDANRLHDALDAALRVRQALGEAPDAPVEVIVCLDHPPGPADNTRLAAIGAVAHQQWDTLLFALHASVPANRLAAVAADPGYGITLIEPNAESRAHLEVSTAQIGVRRIWTGGIPIPGPYDGHPGHAIAVMDTGIDDSHSDIPALTAWSNQVDADASGTDEGEHGTHVAGIAAGRGSAGGTADFSVTYSDIFPNTEGYGWYRYFPVRIGGAAKTITARGYWDAAGGQHWLEIHNAAATPTPIGTAGCSTTEPRVAVSSSLSNVQADAFRAIFGSCTGDGYNTNDTACYLQVDVPYDAHGDGFNLLSGVAPACALVGVKVLNDYNRGTSAQFINGLTWISNNDTTYNIIVANASIGFDGVYSSIDTAVNNLVGGGVSFVCSAGNSQGSVYVRSPGSAGKALCVGAASDDNQLTNYSSLGDPSDPGEPGGIMKPDVLAPGGSVVKSGQGGTNNQITSVDSNDTDQCVDYSTPSGTPTPYINTDQYSDDYKMMYGTSMASPHVAGLVALLADAKGSWSWAGDSDPLLVKSLLCMTSYEVQAAENTTYNPPLGRASAPKDRYEGYGRVDAVGALQALARNLLVDPGMGLLPDTLGSGDTDRKVMACKVSLTNGVTYDFALHCLDGSLDCDLYLYRGTPDSYGDPVLLASSTGGGAGADEALLDYTATTTGTHYLVGKYVSGNGTGSYSLEGGLPVEEWERY